MYRDHEPSNGLPPRDAGSGYHHRSVWERGEARWAKGRGEVLVSRFSGPWTRLLRTWCLALALVGVAVPSFTAHSATVQAVYQASTPVSTLVLAPDGSFYGTSRYGGTYDFGTVFKLSPAGTYQVIYNFTGGDDGANPNAGLVVGPDGQLYGTCQYGGIENAGAVFKMTTGGSITLLQTLFGSYDGAEPLGALALGTNNVLYGTTSVGGQYGFGTVFQVTTNDFFNKIHDFSGSDGSSPAAALTFGADGLLYGTTEYGGANNYGTVFQMSLAGTINWDFSFNNTNGAYPTGPMVQGSDLAFYGTTGYGGTNGFGSVFKVTAVGTFAPLYSLPGETLGSNPLAGLVPGGNNNLYGSVAYGGTNEFGALFVISTSGGFLSLYNFTGGSDGANPMANLCRSGSYNFYGSDVLGGTNYGGSVYQLTLLHFNAAKLTTGPTAIYSGGGGAPSSGFNILTSTNMAVPITSWTSVGSGTFDTNGLFSFTNNVSPLEKSRFYTLQQL